MSAEPIIIDISGHPVGKGRARAAVLRGKGGRIVTTANGAPIVRHYTPEKTRSWEQDARNTARTIMQDMAPLPGPVAIQVNVTMAVPQSWPAWKRTAADAGEIVPTGKPDLDNIIKAAKDAMNGVVWVDDSQVVQVHGAKRYGPRPGVCVAVQPLHTAPAQITQRADLLF